MTGSVFILGGVHLPPMWSVPLAIGAALCIIGYWITLPRRNAPRSRIVVRRLSLTMMLILLPVLVIGLSFADPATQMTRYVAAWAIALLLVMLIILSAAVDVYNTMRLARQQRVDDLIGAIADDARAQARGDQP